MNGPAGRARREAAGERRRIAPKRCLILLMGVAGSGKSTLARVMMQRLSIVYLDNNHIADAFFPHTRRGAAYTKLRPRFYRALYNIVEQNLMMGNSVLLDAPHVKEMQIPGWRDFIAQLVSRAQSKLVVIRCFCSEAVLYSRIESRAEKRDGWKLTHWRDFLKREPIKAPVHFPHLDLNTQADPFTNATMAIDYIRHRQASQRGRAATKRR